MLKKLVTLASNNTKEVYDEIIEGYYLGDFHHYFIVTDASEDDYSKFIEEDEFEDFRDYLKENNIKYMELENNIYYSKNEIESWESYYDGESFNNTESIWIHECEYVEDIDQNSGGWEQKEIEDSEDIILVASDINNSNFINHGIVNVYRKCTDNSLFIATDGIVDEDIDVCEDEEIFEKMVRCIIQKEHKENDSLEKKDMNEMIEKFILYREALDKSYDARLGLGVDPVMEGNIFFVENEEDFWNKAFENYYCGDKDDYEDNMEEFKQINQNDFNFEGANHYVYSEWCGIYLDTIKNTLNSFIEGFLDVTKPNNINDYLDFLEENKMF